MRFQDIRCKNDKEDLKNLGYTSGQKVVVLFEDGGVHWGELYFKEKYECLFNSNLQVSDEKSYRMHYAVGICTLEFF